MAYYSWLEDHTEIYPQQGTSPKSKTPCWVHGNQAAWRERLSALVTSLKGSLVPQPGQLLSRLQAAACSCRPRKPLTASPRPLPGGFTSKYPNLPKERYHAKVFQVIDFFRNLLNEVHALRAAGWEPADVPAAECLLGAEPVLWELCSLAAGYDEPALQILTICHSYIAKPYRHAVPVHLPLHNLDKLFKAEVFQEFLCALGCEVYVDIRGTDIASGHFELYVMAPCLEDFIAIKDTVDDIVDEMRCESPDDKVVIHEDFVNELDCPKLSHNKKKSYKDQQNQVESESSVIEVSVVERAGSKNGGASTSSQVSNDSAVEVTLQTNNNNQETKYELALETVQVADDSMSESVVVEESVIAVENRFSSIAHVVVEDLMARLTMRAVQPNGPVEGDSDSREDVSAGVTRPLGSRSLHPGMQVPPTEPDRVPAISYQQIGLGDLEGQQITPESAGDSHNVLQDSSYSSRHDVTETSSQHFSCNSTQDSDNSPQDSPSNSTQDADNRSHHFPSNSHQNSLSNSLVPSYDDLCRGRLKSLRELATSVMDYSRWNPSLEETDSGVYSEGSNSGSGLALDISRHQTGFVPTSRDLDQQLVNMKINFYNRLISTENV